MDEKDNLFEVFRAADVDEAELQDILLNYFHGAMQLSPDEVVCPGHKTDYSLKLVYGKNGLTKIIPGPKPTDEDVTSIKRRMTKELFSSTQVNAKG